MPPERIDDTPILDERTGLADTEVDDVRADAVRVVSVLVPRIVV